MSHFTTIATKIEDLEALAEAAKKLGLNLQQNASCRYFYGTQYMDAVLKLPGRYDVGLEKQGKQYTLRADLWAGEVEHYIGVQGNKLMQQYAIEKAKREAFQRGFAVTSEKQENGKKQVTLMDPATGGELNLVCDENGRITTKASGFQGDSCMKFKELEESLGLIDEQQLTGDYYIVTSQEEPVEIHTTW